MKFPKPKKRSSTYYRKKCVAKAKEEVRKRDKDTCQYCFRRYPQVAVHCSHVLPEGAYPLMSDEPYNMIVLCAVHHLSGANPRMGSKEPSWHGDPMLFAEWFEKKWPGRTKELREMDLEKRKRIVNWEAKWNNIKSN